MRRVLTAASAALAAARPVLLQTSGPDPARVPDPMHTLTAGSAFFLGDG